MELCWCSSVKAAHDETRARLGLEPGRLGWHNELSVSHVEQLVDGARVHGDGYEAVGLAAPDELFMSADSTDEVHSVVSLDILDVEDLAQDELIDYLRVKLANGRRIVHLVWLDLHHVPLVVHKEAILVLFGHSRGLTVGQGANEEVLLKGALEVSSRHFVQGLEDSVVVEDQKIVCWVEESHEEIEGLLTSNFLTSINRLLSAHFAHIVGRSSPVVTIGDIKGLNALKLSNEIKRVVGCALPKHVSDAILTSDIAV